MRLLLAAAACLALLPARASATNYPYVQDGPVITGVTATDAWVTWYTAHHEGTGTECTVEQNTPLLGDHNTDVPTLTLQTSAAFTDATCSRTHRVHVTGLSASTTYSFALDKPWDAKGGITAAGSFTTAPPAGAGAAVKFVVYGDTRNDLALGGTDTRPHHQALVDAILAHEADAAFLVHTGDLALNIVGVSGDDKGYTEFFAVERTLLANRPLFVVLGNHETIDTTFFDSMFDPARFSGSAHPYYSSLDWGKVHLALADTFEGSPTTLGLGGLNPGVTAAQVEWLDEDLQAAHAAGQASFLGVHQGPYSHTTSANGHGGLQDVVLKLVPLMLKYGVLATFAGHDHYYQRGHEGCIDYLVLGGGGAPMYAPDSSAAGVAVGLQTLSYMVVSVAANGASTMVVKDVNGATIDSFTFSAPDPACGGIDAGPGPDAGSTDAGPTDAGATDAGPTDAGLADAGSSGTGDAGGIDAGGTDAGAGTGTLDGGGCSCTTTNGALLEALALAGLLFRRRRAR